MCQFINFLWRRCLGHIPLFEARMSKQERVPLGDENPLAYYVFPPVQKCQPFPRVLPKASGEGGMLAELARSLQEILEGHPHSELCGERDSNRGAGAKEIAQTAR